MTSLAVGIPLAYGQIGLDVVNSSRTNATVGGTVQDTVRLDSALSGALGIDVANSDLGSNADLEAATQVSTDRVGVNAALDARTEANTQTSQNTVESSADTRVDTRSLVRIGGETFDVNLDNAVRINNTNDVDSDQDLAVFAHTLLEADARIVSIDSDTNEVVVRYSQPAKLLGMVDINAQHTARVVFDVDTGATVKVSKPWYHVFVSGDTNAQTDIQTDISNRLSESLTTQSSADTRMQAIVIEQIAAAFAAHTAAQGTVDTR